MPNQAAPNEPSTEDISAMLDELMQGIKKNGQASEESSNTDKEEAPADTVPADTVPEAEAESEASTDEDTLQKEEPTETPNEDRAELLKQINELSAEILKLKAGVPATQEEVTPTPQPTQVAATPTLQALEVTDDDYAEALSSKEGFIKILGKVQQVAVQQAMLQVPTIVQSLTAQQISMNNMVTDFYRKNADLAPYKEFVSHLATKVSSAHPDWSTEKMMTELPDLVRKSLKIANTEVKKADRKKPAFAAPVSQSKRTAVEKPEVSLEDEINQLIKGR